MYDSRHSDKTRLRLQVTTLFDRGAAMSAETDEADEADHPDATAGREGSFVTTALGNSWSHAVNTRLVLE